MKTKRKGEKKEERKESSSRRDSTLVYHFTPGFETCWSKAWAIQPVQLTAESSYNSEFRTLGRRRAMMMISGMTMLIFNHYLSMTFLRRI